MSSITNHYHGCNCVNSLVLKNNVGKMVCCDRFLSNTSSIKVIENSFNCIIGVIFFFFTFIKRFLYVWKDEKNTLHSMVPHRIETREKYINKTIYRSLSILTYPWISSCYQASMNLSNLLRVSISAP